MIKLMALVMKQLKTKQIMIRTFNEKIRELFDTVRLKSCNAFKMIYSYQTEQCPRHTYITAQP